MRLRFLAAAGPPTARQRLALKLRSHKGFALVEPFSNGSITVWTEAQTPFLTNENKSAALVGRLFDRSAMRRVQILPERSPLEAILVRDFWGSYVLFTGDGMIHRVMRDPSGSIPVYYGSSGALQLYASDGDMLKLAWPEPFQPDLAAARHWLKYPFLRTKRTGALGVSELAPGMIHEVGRSGTRVSQAWSPGSFAEPTSAIASFGDAAALLREEILRSVALLAAGQSNMILQLSGGLDSSILAAALAEAGMNFRAVTFATISADGDERPFARQVADHFEIDLQEIGEADLDFIPSPAGSPLQRPANPLLQPLRRALVAAAREGPTVLLDGGGGDNLFGSISTAAPAIDALRQKGITAAIGSLRNIAARHGCTFWAAAGSAVRRGRRGRVSLWPADHSFLVPPVTPNMPEAHPWLASSDALRPGSADHLRMIVGLFHFLADPETDTPANLHPLMCQPLIELCLRIPSWLWLEGGRDRAVARAAFRHLLPPSVLDRRGKGSLQGMIVRGFEARRAELRDYLVEGRLVEHGIADPAAIAAYFDTGGQATARNRILELASAEQWLRSFG
jgi:asparagine synthase (glutamine-hydrolysing)